MRSLYLDHAATSFPKSAGVREAMAASLERPGTPGRGAHAGAREAARAVQNARELVARMLGAPNADGVVFTASATDSLHLAFLGLLRDGDHVVTTQVEHNSVRRPLHAWSRRGGRLSVVPARADGTVELEALLAAVEPRTRLVVLSHASNVTGALLPVAELGRSLRAREPRPLLLVDVAQTAGYRPLDDVAQVSDLLVAAGHKGPGGPAGVGILWVRAGTPLVPARTGGTGSDSERLDPPTRFPESFEPGTPNLPGIEGLAAAVASRLEEGIERVAQRRRVVTERFLAGIAALERIRCHGPNRSDARDPVFPLTFLDYSAAEAAILLESQAGIVARPGLHCAPGTHEALGTAPDGALRLSFGPGATDEEVDFALASLRMLTP